MKAKIAVVGLAGNSVFMRVPHFHTGGETIHATDFHSEFGGKGFNQAVAAARQGAKVALLAAAGRRDADAMAEFLGSEHVDGVISAKGTPSAHATILTDGSGETHVTVFPGAALEKRDVDLFERFIADADILLLNNEVPNPVNVKAAAAAMRHGVKIVVNPAPARALPKAIGRNGFLFTPNEFEEAALGDVAGEVVTTLGARGCRIRSTGAVVPAASCGAAVDTTGAGDVFTATLCVRLAEGEALEDACRAANVAAAMSVTRRYVMPSIPHREEVEAGRR